MNCLVITNLYPNNQEPNKGQFVKQEIEQLMKYMDIHVIAPIPWFLPLKWIQKWYKYSRIHREESINGIHVDHPRYFVTPKIGRSFYGLFYFLGIYNLLKKYERSQKPDIYYVHYAYPDGFGVALASYWFKKFYIVKVRGSDINVYSEPLLRRKMIQYALRHALQIITVSNALKYQVLKLGIPENKIIVIPNGVNTILFHPTDKLVARNRLGYTVNEKLVLFIGNLVPIKGVEHLITAFSILIKSDDNSSVLKLIIIGEGELKKKLMDYAMELNIDKSISFQGQVSHEELPFWYNASDVVCLPSLMEGYPNVVVESLACGKPVVASNVGGIPEIIHSPELGILTEPGHPESLANSIRQALDKNWDSKKIAESMKSHSWDHVAEETTLILQKKV